MKDSRFIELINLYVDHQLTPAEARELETELQANPARHRTYQQYCRMQKACTQLFETERANAPATPRLARALADANRKISPSAPAREKRSFASTWGGIFALGGLAATAACVAVFFALRDPAPQPQHAQGSIGIAVINTPAPAPASATVHNAVATNPSAAQSASATVALADNTPAFSLQTAAKRFRLPVITSFAPATDNKTAANPNTSATDEAVIAWTKDLGMRPIRKVSIEDAISALRRIETPQIGTTILRISPAATHGENVDEITVIEFKR